MTDALTSLDMSTGLRKVAERAKREPAAQFHSLAHLIDEQLLAGAYARLKSDAAVGVDGITKEQYGQDLQNRLRDLHERLKTMRYRHQPIRRMHIPKEKKGQTRPIGISTVNANYTFKQYSFGMGRDLPPLSPPAGPTFPGVKDATVIGSGDVDFARSDAWDTQCAARVDRLGRALAIGAGWAASAAFCLGGVAGVGEAGGDPPPGD